jgi:hypothetical protein
LEDGARGLFVYGGRVLARFATGTENHAEVVTILKCAGVRAYRSLAKRMGRSGIIGGI